jgi:hypothetical protein
MLRAVVSIPEIRFHSSQEICATWGAVVIRICNGVRTEIDDLMRVEALFDELLETRKAIGMLLVFTHGTPWPTAAAQRYAISSMRSKYDGKVVLGVAMLGLGFWANSFRGTLDAVTRVVRGGTIAIEGTAEAATKRLAMELIGIDPEALLGVYQELWGRLEHGQPRKAAAG